MKVLHADRDSGHVYHVQGHRRPMYILLPKGDHIPNVGLNAPMFPTLGPGPTENQGSFRNMLWEWGP